MNNKRKILSELLTEIRNNSSELKKFRKKGKMALDEGVDINSKIYRGRTLLHYAVKYNSKGIIKILVQLGANPNICDDDFNTPLHYAVENNHYISTKELIKLNADIDMPGEFDQTPLHIAVLKENLDIIKILLEEGADINQVDEKNLTPLDYARDEKNERIILFLEKSVKEEK